MNTILRKRQLSDEVFMFVVKAPLIAEERQPGQFIILQLDTEFGERIPLTIADADAKEGTHHAHLPGGRERRPRSWREMNVGEKIANLVGPLGKPTHIEKFGTVVCVGGGIGVAPLYPIAQGMKKAGEQADRDHRRARQGAGDSGDGDAGDRGRGDRLHGRRVLRAQGPGDGAAEGALRRGSQAEPGGGDRSAGHDEVLRAERRSRSPCRRWCR